MFSKAEVAGVSICNLNSHYRQKTPVLNYASGARNRWRGGAAQAPTEN